MKLLALPPASMLLAAVMPLLGALALRPPLVAHDVADSHARRPEGHASVAAARVAADGDLNPFDPVPAITLPTTAGPLVLGGPASGESTVVIGYSGLSARSRSVSSASIGELIAASPTDAHYVFVSYSEDPGQHAADVAAYVERVDAAIGALGDEAAREHWRRHLHVVSERPTGLPSPAPEVLRAWAPAFVEVAAEWRAEGGAAREMREVATTDSGWAKPLEEALTGRLELFGTAGSEQALACPPAAPTRPITGLVALVERGVCPFVDKAANVQAHGGIGALLYTSATSPKGTMAGSCERCPSIPVAMIDRDAGLHLAAALEAGAVITVTLRPVEFVAMDQQSRARELGSVPYPFNGYLEAPIDDLRMLAFATQYFHHEHERDSRLAAEEAAGEVTRVPLLVGEWVDDPDWAGKRSFAEVVLPDAHDMSAFDTLEVDLSLSCPDHRRSSCPAWDYIVDMTLCEGESDRCDLLLARWITPYWAEGRWVTDVSPLLGWLSDGGSRRFAFYTQQRYQVDLELRLSNRGKGLVPKRAADLGLDGGAFWDDYNARFFPIEFDVPEWADKVEVVSYITGHGFGHDTANCAEFCNHTHHISVNGGPDHVRQHPETDRVLGCAERVPLGVVPNQGGTWVYGRGGWCPGQDVTPWVIDVTGEVTAGERSELTYRGLFHGADYVPEPADPANPGQYDATIRMRSYLVYWAEPDVEAGPVHPPAMRIPGTIYLPRSLRQPGD